MTTNNKPNRLIAEKSPYLLQHAYNPVDWYPWGEEAFEKAKVENKPVFVSIGYSTCHWCHVMERESFEDEDVARLLNDNFISIKVDREERPDIDSIYMSVCQVMTGHGGWPLNVFLTPDQVPFYVGTYFPKHARMGMPGMMDVVSQLADIYKNEPEKVMSTGKRIIDAIQPKQQLGVQLGLTETIVEECFKQMSQMFDPQYGGFGEAPKFPTPHHLTFLLRYYRHTGNERALEMVEKTLYGLASGGIYDHIGFGFSRYSTDQEYLVPHFEKMLYDNAMLAIAYTEVYQITGKDMYQRIADEIFTYVLRDMRDVEGGFYSAEDADSEGVEGKFYVWTPNEVEEVLGEEDADVFCAVYDITEDGNFEGKSIPNLIDQPIEWFAEQNGFDLEELRSNLETWRNKLFEHREHRIHPHKDDKILTAWNALMITALAKAGKVFCESSYIDSAEKAMQFVEDKLIMDGRVMVRYREGEVKQEGFIDDYGYLVWAYLELYEATLNLRYLEKARKIADNMIDLFWDDKDGGFFFYGSDHEDLLIRPKEVYDGALPSGNSVAALQLIRLARLTGELFYEEIADGIFKAFTDQIQMYPFGHTYMLQAFLTSRMGMKEVVVLGGQNGSFIEELQKGFYPEVTYLIAQDASDFTHIAPFASEYQKKEGETTYYICENFVCHQPLTDEAEAVSLLQNK